MKVNVSFDEDPKTLPARFGESYPVGASDWNNLKNRPFYDNEDGTVAKQLDEKYLSILESTYVSVLPEQDVTFETPSDFSTPSVSTNLSIDSLSLNIGEVYKVEIDGVVYECTANTTRPIWAQDKIAEYLGSPVPGTGNAMPFVVFCGEGWDGVTFYYDGSGTFTKRIRIYQGEEGCYKIKPEYLPLYNGEVESV